VHRPPRALVLQRFQTTRRVARRNLLHRRHPARLYFR
jgi:hypothetical protein